jgi:predicted MFS family arabinose efflux permease
VGLLLSPLILQRYGWRALFYLFGLAGAPLLALWMLVVPNTPPANPSSAGGSGSGSAAGGSSVTLRQLMSKRATWAIIIANFGEACGARCFMI